MPLVLPCGMVITAGCENNNPERQTILIKIQMNPANWLTGWLAHRIIAVCLPWQNMLGQKNVCQASPHSGGSRSRKTCGEVKIGEENYEIRNC